MYNEEPQDVTPVGILITFIALPILIVIMLINVIFYNGNGKDDFII